MTTVDGLDGAEIFAPLLGAAQTSGPDEGRTTLRLHQGVVLAWSATGNRVRINGNEFTNLRSLSSMAALDLSPGDTVAILAWQTTYFVLGRVVAPESNLLSPVVSVPLYPLFVSSQPPGGLPGYTYTLVPTGSVAQWEGRLRVTHPTFKAEFITGNAVGVTPPGTATYYVQVQVPGQTVELGTWAASSTLDVTVRSFDVRRWIGQEWIKIMVGIRDASGTDPNTRFAFQALGAYLTR